MRYLTLIIGLLITYISFGQIEKKDVYDLPIPKNLESCFDILDKTLTDKEIDIAKNYPEDSIYFNKEFKYGADFFHAWKLYEGSRLTEYFNKQGLFGSHEIYETILISYHRYLNNIPIDLNKQIDKYKAKQEEENQEYLKRLELDSINGVYIPKDIKDCFITLDSMLSKSDIDSIKSLSDREETIKYHLGFGMWLRNNWGLWGGSRLQKYFLDRDIKHPDSMSALILKYYYDWLHDDNKEWMKFDEK
ncbi:MAG: DUF6794 domain-containing protein [Flavobacteriaceae bacterium]|nr:DUF6794 domain-containing protein [Flavobacteriaceae bacterium]